MIYDFNDIVKTSVTVIIVFIIIKFLIETRLIEAILLALIIAISIYIIENIIKLTLIESDSEVCKKCLITNDTKTTNETKETKEKFNNIDNTTSQPSTTPTQNVQPIDSEYKDSYVSYQQNGDQAKEEKDTEKVNLFRLKIGNPEVTKPFIKDGKKYYDDIFSYSNPDSLNADGAMESDLKYGDYNYLGPINDGMINPAYTFISPSNWYPVQPFPPHCVTNKNCTTCPILMDDGNNYMTFASLKDFNRARRFTGNMGINVNYIKDVLNKDGVE